MTDRLRIHELAESTHRVQNPTSIEKVNLVGEIAGVDGDTTVLDIGCGKGTMLVEWAMRFGCSGVGVDPSAVFIAAAQDAAVHAGVAGRVSFVNTTGASFHTDRRFDVVACIGAAWFAGDTMASLERLRGWSAPGGTLLLGEPFRRGVADVRGYSSLAELLDGFGALQLDLVEFVAANVDDWDRYYAAQWRNLHDWLSANDDDPLAPQVRERITSSRRRYLEDEREQLGWAIFVLRDMVSG